MKRLLQLIVVSVLLWPSSAAAHDAAADSAGVEIELDPVRLKARMAVVGATELGGAREWERRKVPKVAMFSSMAVPGLGQVYNSRRIKTVIMVGTFTFYLRKIMVENKSKVRRRAIRDQFDAGTPEWNLENAFVDFHRQNALDWIWWSGAVWVIGALDAFIDAHLFDVRVVDPDVIQGSHGAKYIGLSFRF